MRARVAIAAIAGISSARADDLATVIIDPLPRTSYLRLEPSYTWSSDGDVFELHGRGVMVGTGPLPAMTWAVGLDTSLHGDLAVTPLSGVRFHHGVIGIGLAADLPAAGGAARLGPAWFAQTDAVPHVDLSALVRTYFVVAGGVDRADALATLIEPGVAVTLPYGVVLSSSGELEIDWLAGSARVPVNLQVGRAFGDHVIVTLGPEVEVAGPDRGDVTIDVQIDIVGPH